MSLLHHDTTETQTDCPRPLSRKKLKKLMPQGRTRPASRELLEIAQGIPGKKSWPASSQKHEQRRKKLSKKLRRIEKRTSTEEKGNPQ